jgi:hypothetical protein
MIAFSSHHILQISSVLSIFNHLILMVRTITFVEQADTLNQRTIAVDLSIPRFVNHDHDYC